MEKQLERNNTPKTLIFDRKMLEDKEYWTEKLSVEREPTSLRYDHLGPSVPTACGQGQALSLRDLSQKLIRLTQGKPLLVYTTLASALMICLHKYTMRSAIVIGSPTRRQVHERQHHAGWLPIIGNIEPQATFQQVLLGVRQEVLEAYARQQYPVDGLQENPFFNISLTLQGLHDELSTDDHDLAFHFAIVDEHVQGEIVYRLDRYRPDSIERLAGHFTQILRQALDNTQLGIVQLQMLTQQEMHLLEQWNATQQPFQDTSCIHDLFVAQAERVPASVAIVYEDIHITYEELNRRANQLARYLQQCGVRPEARVGIYMERSAE